MIFMTESKDLSTIFIHIPKTAGTTVRSILEDCLPRERLYFLYLENASNPGMAEFEALTIEEKQNIQVYCGHFDFGFHRYLPQPCKYITIMREPVGRTISLYHHLLQEENARDDISVAKMQSRIKSEKLSLEDFVASGITLDTDNAQTRILSGESPKFGQCSQEILEKAKSNLKQHFAATGLTERFDESIMLIHKVMGWPTPFYVKQNVSRNSSKEQSPPQRTIETIKQFNQFDIQLYDFAETLLNEQIEKQPPSFAREIEEFKIANRLVTELLKDKRSKILLEQQINALKNSWSWRMTAPMRKIVGIIKK